MRKQLLLVTGLLSITILCGTVLTSIRTVAETTKQDNFSLTIPTSCTMSGVGTSSHTASMSTDSYSAASGSPYENGIGKTTITTFCNDENGFSIYAVGYTGATEGNNTLVGVNTSTNIINTGVHASTDTTSNWAMRITKVTDPSESYLPQNMSIQDNFDSWHAVPDTFAKVAQYHATTGSSVTDDLLGAKVETTYAAYIASDQAPDTYTGQVKYVLVHPYNGVSPDTDKYTTTVTLGTNITKITFTSDITEPQSVKTSGDTVSLYDGITYTITATTEDGYELASWTTDQYGTIGNATQNPTTFTATGTTTLTATAQEQLPEHTCTKEYRLQNADGTYPATYTSDGTETLRQGSTCTYTKSVENYQTQEDTATMTTDQTISLDLPRNTYELTVNKDNTNITTVTGAGTYRWGETVNISATPATGSRFTTWTQTSGTTSTFADATSATTTFTMPTSAATITANGEPIPSYNVTVTLDTNTTSVSFTNATYGTQNITTSGSAASLRSGVEYTITATFASGYKLNNWTAGSGATIGSTTANPTTLVVTSATTLSASSHEVTQSSCSTSPMISTVASGITYMQDINSGNKSTVLSALTQDATYQIKDNRDNETYCVGKLADGNLWLLDNLALDLTNSTILNGMSSSNTNASDTTLGYLKNGGGTTSDQYAITGVVNQTDSPTYASGYSYSDPLVNLTNKDVIPSDATSQAGQYKVGGYYNYCAASAGSYCYGNGTSAGTSSGNATEDICPKGWRMPTGNTSGEYSALANAIYGSTGSTSDATAYANYRSALHIPLSGYFGSGSAYSQGSRGRWWSSTRYDNSTMYYLGADTSNISPANNLNRSGGNSVRCILDPAPTTETLTVSLDSNVTSVTFSDGMSPDQTVTTNGGTVNLTPNTSYTITATTASGYEFSSWTAGSGATLGSTTQNPTTLTITSATTLSATSREVTQSSCATSPMISTVASGITYMQDINSGNKSTVLSALTQDATYQIKDNRDNETYCVGKLADGNLWLLDNLALDLTNSTVLNGMNESNTHASNTTLGYLKNGGGTASDQYAITGVANWTDSPTYASGYSFSDPLVNLTNKDIVPIDATSTSGQYKVGGYYNYCAASAGSYCYGNGTDWGTSSGDATEDICPKGWRMPTGNTSGEYSALANEIYGSTGSTSDATAYANYRSALRLPLSGYFNNGSAYSQGSNSYWWSSTRFSDYSMYDLYASTSNMSNINPASSNFRRNGNSVRCVLDPTPTTETLTVSLDSNVTSVTFSDGTSPDQTVTTNGGTVNLTPNTSYTITATTASGYEFSSWTPGTGATLGSTTANPTTLTITSATTLSVTSQQIPSYNVTVTLDSNTTSVGFYNATYGTQNITTSGSAASLRSGVEYIITATFASDYEFSSWTPGANATLGSTTANPTTLTVTSATTLSATSREEGTGPQPSTAGCINYFANASNAVGTMGCQSATDGNSIVLLASNFSRAGYGFAGWSDSFDYATNPNAHFYGPQETITVPTGTTANGLSLYAVWIKSQGSIQDQSKVASVCNSLTTAATDGTANLTSVSALTDQRDNNTYAIAKLADGKCWMIENLRLESTNSDNTTGALAQGYGTSATYGNFGGLANAESANFTDSTTANSLYYSGTQSGDATIDIGTTNYPGRRMPRYNNWNNQATSANRPQNPTTNSATNSTTHAGMYSYGNYYTWHAAIADLTFNDTKNKSTTGTSLCPAGWHLPKGGNNQNTANNEFLAFSEALIGAKPANYDSQTYPSYTDTPEGSDASNKLRAYPNNFLFSGYFGTSSAYISGSYGYYWSSTAVNSDRSYILYLSSPDVFPGTNRSSKFSGRSIRCTVGASTPTPTTEMVTVTLDSHVTSVTFSDGTNPDQTVSTSGGTVNLTPNTSYTITATTASGYEFSSWTAGSGATLGSTTANPTTLTVTSATTLSVTSQQIPSYAVTVTLDSNTTSVGFYNADLGTQQVTTSGGTATLRRGVEYIITATTASGYEFSSWTAGTGATIGSTTANPTTLTVTGTTTLSATSKLDVPEPQPATAGCINYFANADDAVGTMGCQSASDNASVDLLASNFSRTGYGFAGWSDSYDYATNPSAHFYGPQETITVPTGTTANGLSLYAVWVKSQGSIQDQSKVASVCNSLTTAPTDGTANLTSVSALTDQRDSNTYAIAKLADGKCWMIENLRLDNTAEHNSDGSLAQGYGTSATYGNFGGLADAENSGFSSTYTANSLYYSDTQEGSASIDIGTTDYPAYRMPRYNNLNTSIRASNPTNNSGNMYSYGNYYTWHAAIADLTYNGTNNQSTTGTSLCPAGWHLPTGGMAYASGSTRGVNVTGDTSTFREFYNLGYKTMDEVKTAYEDTPNGGQSYYYSSNTTNTAGKTATAALRSFPNNFLYSGYFGTSSAYDRGSTGYYWSSTARNNYFSYYLRLYSSYVYPGTDGYDKYSGQSIRCTVGT